jgi:hypothetical protein
MYAMAILCMQSPEKGRGCEQTAIARFLFPPPASRLELSSLFHPQH